MYFDIYHDEIEVEHVFELDERPAGGMHVEVGLPVALVATIANLK